MIYFTDNFRKAWYQQVEIEKSTTETEIEEYEASKPKRIKKVSAMKNKSLFDNISDQSNDSDGNCLQFNFFYLQMLLVLI